VAGPVRGGKGVLGGFVILDGGERKETICMFRVTGDQKKGPHMDSMEKEEKERGRVALAFNRGLFLTLESRCGTLPNSQKKGEGGGVAAYIRGAIQLPRILGRIPQSQKDTSASFEKEKKISFAMSSRGRIRKALLVRRDQERKSTIPKKKGKKKNARRTERIRGHRTFPWSPSIIRGEDTRSKNAEREKLALLGTKDDTASSGTGGG